MKLEIELVPQSLWGRNLRSELPKSKWDFLRQECYQNATHVCEICGGEGRKHPVECHEIWEYDEKNSVQRLVGLIALCPDCHMVKHFGLAEVKGNQEKALRHLAKVNGISIKEAIEHVIEQKRIWNERNKKEWSFDLSWIENK